MGGVAHDAHVAHRVLVCAPYIAETVANRNRVGIVGIVGKTVFHPCYIHFSAAYHLPTLPTIFRD